MRARKKKTKKMNFIVSERKKATIERLIKREEKIEKRLQKTKKELEIKRAKTNIIWTEKKIINELKG